MLFCEKNDLVWEIICVSEREWTTVPIVKINDNVFEKNDECESFPLIVILDSGSTTATVK